MSLDSNTRLEWVADSDFRFFPTIPDETFGYILHAVDLAANKIMAAAGRREIRRNANYPMAEWKAPIMREPIDPMDTMARLRAALTEAETFVARMPTEKAGLLLLKSGKVVQPDPDHLDEYQTHAGQRRGHWPASSEITAAMFERAAQNREPSNA